MNSLPEISVIPHSRPTIGDDDHQAVTQVLRSLQLASGATVKRFEQCFQGYTGHNYSFAVNSGTLALIIALKALEVGPGDEVILPTYVCYSVAKAVEHIGAAVKLCDIGESWTMTPEQVEQVVTTRSKAIVLVNVFGIPCDVGKFQQFGIPIIEDSCQDLRPESTLAHVNVHSFHATKCMTTGTGGMISTNLPELKSRIGDEISGNRYMYQMSDIQATIGVSQLKKYDSFLEKRQRIAQRYFESLPEEYTVKLKGLNGTNYFRFLLWSQCFENFDELRSWFSERGVELRRGVDNLIHRIHQLPDSNFPNAYQALEQTLSIPVYPSLTEAEQDRVIELIQAKW